MAARSSTGTTGGTGAGQVFFRDSPDRVSRYSFVPSVTPLFSMLSLRDSAVPATPPLERDRTGPLFRARGRAYAREGVALSKEEKEGA